MTVQEQATVVDCQVVLKGENPYGEVTAGSIPIEATCKTISFKESQIETRQRLNFKEASMATEKILFNTIDSADGALGMDLSSLLMLAKRTTGTVKQTHYRSLGLAAADRSCY